MPPLLALTLPEIIGISTGLVGAGSAAYSGYEAAQQPGENAALQNSAALSQQQIAAQQAGTQKQQAINAQVANADQQTGGSLSQPGLANLSSLLAGYGGQAGGASNPFTSASNGTSSGPGLQDALSQLTSGTPSTQPTQSNFSGGS